MDFKLRIQSTLTHLFEILVAFGVIWVAMRFFGYEVDAGIYDEILGAFLAAVLKFQRTNPRRFDYVND